jgi:hypothetical protein
VVTACDHDPRANALVERRISSSTICLTSARRARRPGYGHQEEACQRHQRADDSDVDGPVLRLFPSVLIA